MDGSGAGSADTSGEDCRLAVLEVPGRRAETARAYRREHPDRAGALKNLLEVLDHPGHDPDLYAASY